MDFQFLGFLFIFSAILDLVVYYGIKKRTNDKNFAELTVGSMNLAEGLVFYELSVLMLELESSFSDQEEALFLILRLSGIIMIGYGILVIIQKIYMRLSVCNTSAQASSRLSNPNSTSDHKRTTNNDPMPEKDRTSVTNHSSGERWECAGCHSKNPPSASACVRCGTKREQMKGSSIVTSDDRVICPECGTLYERQTSFCTECGAKL